MSEPQRTQAAVRRTWWPGWIWGVPVAAVLIVGWLAIRTLARGGVDVTVSFADAANTQTDAKVIYKGVPVGQVEKISLGKDGGGVIMRLHLDDVMKPLLRQGTRFFLVGARPDLGDPSTLRAIVAGPTIGLDPGPGAPARRFAGLSAAPPVLHDERGGYFVLTSDRETVHEGSEVDYRGQKVGVVTQARYAAPGRFVVTVFVREPYRQLVRTSTRFWSAGGVRVSLGDGGVKARLASIGALVDGAVGFDSPMGEEGAPVAPAGRQFTLYHDKGAADAAAGDAAATYLVAFDGDVGGLAAGAPVSFRGFHVGQVSAVRLQYDPRSGRPTAPVLIALDPARFGISGGRAAFEPILARWVGEGLRARLVQDPPVVGARSVSLEFVSGAPRGALVRAGRVAEIPAASGADVSQLTGKASSVLAKLDALPIEAIGSNLKAVSGNLRRLTSSPRLADSLDHLDSALREVDRTIRQASPDVAPTVRALHRAADSADAAAAAANSLIGGSPTSQDSDVPSAVHELTEAARSVRSLADELDQHPEALIEGRK